MALGVWGMGGEGGALAVEAEVLGEERGDLREQQSSGGREEAVVVGGGEGLAVGRRVAGGFGLRENLVILGGGI